jgi:proliferating cell nuclear antigen
MELTIVNKRSLEFKQILDTIHELPISETNLNFNENGLNIQTMDSSHVSVVMLDIDKQFFDKYQCISPITIGINLDLLTKLLKSVTKKDHLRLVKNDIDDYLFLSIYNDVRTQDFNVPLFEFSTDALSIPSIDYRLVYNISSDEFSKVLNDISLVDGRDITLTLGDKKFILTSTGDLGKTTISLEGISLADTDDNTDNPLTNICTIIKDGQPLTASFTLEFLKNISRAKVFSKHGAVISFSENYPLCICYPFGENSNLRLHLAPKLEEEL